jgi:hypothetical protein
MKASASIASTVFFLISFAGSAWATGSTTGVHVGPGPEISAGILGMTLAGGVVYLIKRRNRRPV